MKGSISFYTPLFHQCPERCNVRYSNNVLPTVDLYDLSFWILSFLHLNRILKGQTCNSISRESVLQLVKVITIRNVHVELCFNILNLIRIFSRQVNEEFKMLFEGIRGKYKFTPTRLRITQKVFNAYNMSLSHGIFCDFKSAKLQVFYFFYRKNFLMKWLNYLILLNKVRKLSLWISELDFILFDETKLWVSC